MTHSPMVLTYDSLTHDSLIYDSLTYDSLTHDSLTHDSLTHDSLTDRCPSPICGAFSLGVAGIAAVLMSHGNSLLTQY